MKKVSIIVFLLGISMLNVFAQQQSNKGFKESEMSGSPNTIIAFFAGMELSAMNGTTTFDHTNTSFAENIKNIQYQDAVLTQNKESIDNYYSRVVPYGVSVGTFSDNVYPKAFTYNAGKIILLPGVVSPYSYNTTKLETPLKRARDVFSTIGKALVYSLASEASRVNFNTAYVGVCVTVGSKDFSKTYASNTYESLIIVVPTNQLKDFRNCKITEDAFFEKCDFYYNGYFFSEHDIMRFDYKALNQ